MKDLTDFEKCQKYLASSMTHMIYIDGQLIAYCTEHLFVSLEPKLLFNKCFDSKTERNRHLTKLLKFRLCSICEVWKNPVTITYYVLRYGETESKQISTFYTEYEMRQALDRYESEWRDACDIQYDKDGKDCAKDGDWNYVWWCLELAPDDSISPPKWAWAIRITKTE